MSLNVITFAVNNINDINGIINDIIKTNRTDLHISRGFLVVYFFLLF